MVHRRMSLSKTQRNARWAQLRPRVIQWLGTGYYRDLARALGVKDPAVSRWMNHENPVVPSDHHMDQMEQLVEQAGP